MLPARLACMGANIKQLKQPLASELFLQPPKLSEEI
jgi:hypothetical protein